VPGQDIPEFIKAAHLILDLDCDLANQAPMLVSNPRQNLPFTSFGIDFQ
jgi:hypothetical protein